MQCSHPHSRQCYRRQHRPEKFLTRQYTSRIKAQGRNSQQLFVLYHGKVLAAKSILLSPPNLKKLGAQRGRPSMCNSQHLELRRGA